MFNEARAMLILQAYRNGKTLQQIGEQYGISKERVRQLCKRASQIEQQRLSKDPWFELSPRCRNALINWKGCSPTIESVLEFYPTLADLKPIPALGVVCIRELQAWLVRHGREPLI
jgi:uncharacterized protein (DUF433 family)